MITQALWVMAAVLWMILLVLLYWQYLLRKEAQAELHECHIWCERLQVLCHQYESELRELRSAVRAEKAQAEQLKRQLNWLSLT